MKKQWSSVTQKYARPPMRVNLYAFVKNICALVQLHKVCKETRESLASGRVLGIILGSQEIFFVRAEASRSRIPLLNNIATITNIFHKAICFYTNSRARSSDAQLVRGDLRVVKRLNVKSVFVCNLCGVGALRTILLF